MRLLSPKRNPATAQKAHAIVREERTGRAAWVALARAGIVPRAFFEDQRRMFWGRGGAAHAPDKVRDAWLVAIDWKRMQRAETLARRAMKSLRRYGQHAPETVVWTFKAPKRWHPAAPPAAQFLIDTGHRTPSFGTATQAFKIDQEAQRLWQREHPRSAKDKNPFHLLLEVWSLGYAVDTVLPPEDGDALVICCPIP